MDLYSYGLKSRINFALEPEWAYIPVGLYSSFTVTKEHQNKQKFIRN